MKLIVLMSQPLDDANIIFCSPVGFYFQNWDAIVDTVLKINFMVMTSFNIVVFVNVDEVHQMKMLLEGKGAIKTQCGHFLVKGTKSIKGKSAF